MGAATRKSRSLFPGENPQTASLEAARRWVTIYEQRQALLGLAPSAASIPEANSIEAGLRFWRERIVELAGLDFDPERRILKADGEREIGLTRRELELLEFLVHHAGRSFPDHVLALRAWGERLSGDQVRIYVRRLRSKLAGTEWEIVSRRGLGYSLERTKMATAPNSASLSRDAVLHAVGRARSLLAEQQMQLNQAVAATERLKQTFADRRQDGNGAAEAAKRNGAR